MLIIIFYKVQQYYCLCSTQKHMKTIGRGPQHVLQWFLMCKSVIIIIRRINGDYLYLIARLLELYACFVLNTRHD